MPEMNNEKNSDAIIQIEGRDDMLVAETDAKTGYHRIVIGAWAVRFMKIIM